MKTKNVILGLLVFVFGVGSAFASLLFTPQYIKVWRTLADKNLNVETCLEVGECEDAGSIPCQVQVLVSTGSDVTDHTYRQSNCTIPLFQSQEDIPFIAEEVYELIEPK